MISPRATKYLVDVGVKRYGLGHTVMEKDIISWLQRLLSAWMECMNVVLKDARDLSVVRMVEELRNLLQRWFWNHQQQALSMKTELTTWVDMELRLRFNKSSGYEVEPIHS